MPDSNKTKKSEKTKMFKRVIPAIIFGVVYALLILFGWGLDDIGGFFSHPARLILFWVTITVNTLTMLFKDKFNVEFFKKGETKNDYPKRFNRNKNNA